MRARRFDDDLCLICRKRPRAMVVRDGKPSAASYCKTCRDQKRKESRLRNKIQGHARFAWKVGRGKIPPKEVA